MWEENFRKSDQQEQRPGGRNVPVSLRNSSRQAGVRKGDLSETWPEKGWGTRLHGALRSVRTLGFTLSEIGSCLGVWSRAETCTDLYFKEIPWLLF